MEWCGPEAAAEVHRLTQAAFAPQAVLDPPSGATRETVEVVRADLAEGRGVLAHLGRRPVAAARVLLEERHVHVRRVAVDPGFHRQGIARILMCWIHAEATRLGYAEVRLGVRKQLLAPRALYESLGYRQATDEGYWVVLRLSLPAEVEGD